MKQIAVISGKGGTGKTVLTASFAALARDAVLADCDVDAADLHLLLKPKIRERHEFKSGKKAEIDKKLCNECGKCLNVCRFDAIDNDFVVDPISCEGCDICSYICPVNAITMKENLSGELFISDTKYGPFVYARLGIAEENSGKLVTLVKQNAKEIGERENKDYIIIDGPPGIGCPVISSLANIDLALIVTEPTLSGIHDMERVADVAKHFGVHTKVVINKYDINLKNTQDIRKICHSRNIEVLAELPYSQKVIQSLVKSSILVEFCNDRIVKDIIALWERIK